MIDGADGGHRPRWSTHSAAGRLAKAAAIAAVTPSASSLGGRPSTASSGRPRPPHSAAHVLGSEAATVTYRPSPHWYNRRSGVTGMG
jgi:hypothetical protein